MALRIPSANIDENTSMFNYNIPINKITHGKLRILAASKNIKLPELLGLILYDWFKTRTPEEKVIIIDNFTKEKLDQNELIQDEL